MLLMPFPLIKQPLQTTSDVSRHSELMANIACSLTWSIHEVWSFGQMRVRCTGRGQAKDETTGMPPTNRIEHWPRHTHTPRLATRPAPVNLQAAPFAAQASWAPGPNCMPGVGMQPGMRRGVVQAAAVWDVQCVPSSAAQTCSLLWSFLGEAHAHDPATSVKRHT